MKDKIEITFLEGWLLKKKAPGKQKVLRILSGDRKRWFQVKELTSFNSVEVTLCYFKSQHETEARGWIYLRDVTQLHEDGKNITIVSLARSITVEAKSRAEHKFWFEGISRLCPSVKRSDSQGYVSNSADDKLRNSMNSSQPSSRRNSYDQKAERKICIGDYDSEYRSNRMAESKRDCKSSLLSNSTRSSASSQDTDTDVILSRALSSGKNTWADGDCSKGKYDHRISAFSEASSEIVTGASGCLYNHTRNVAPSSSLIVSQEMLRSGGICQTSMRDIKLKEHYSHSTGDCFNEQNDSNFEDDCDGIETLNISIESSFSRNSSRWTLNGSRDNSARNQPHPSSSTYQMIPPPREVRRKRMQPASNYSDEAGRGDDRARNAAEISISKPIVSGRGRRTEFSDVPEVETPSQKAHYYRARDDMFSEDSNNDQVRAARNLNAEKNRQSNSLHQNEDKSIDPESGVTSRASPVSNEGSIGTVSIRGRPPPPPNGTKLNPYTGASRIQISSLTEPKVSHRKASDPTFVNDNWDDDTNTRDQCVKKSGKDRTSLINGKAMKNDVLAGPNWLHENFDED